MLRGAPRMTKPVDLSIVIVNYNTRELLLLCLRTVFEAKNDSITEEVIVVDNGSKDQSAEEVRKKFPDVKIFQNQENLGFSRANNIGIKAAKGRYILLLNSDTELHPGVLEYMVQLMDKDPKVGVSTCRVELPDGKMDPACHRGFPTPWAALTYFTGLEKLFPHSKLFGQYHLGFKDLTTIHEIDSPIGAFFLVRKKVIDEVGLLDEAFFMYGEDLDWAFRIKKAGWKIMFCPDEIIIHKKKQSGRANANETLRKETDAYFYEAMILFYKKHYRQRYGFLISSIILFGIFVKAKLSRLW